MSVLCPCSRTGEQTWNPFITWWLASTSTSRLWSLSFCTTHSRTATTQAASSVQRRLVSENWSDFLDKHNVTDVAMESTAQYWRPVWMTLESEFTLTLAQARSTRERRGRKWDKADAQRIARRLLSGDLTVSFVPSPEQRDWRLLSRTQVAM